MKLALGPSNDWARRLKKSTRNLSELESVAAARKSEAKAIVAGFRCESALE
jgi:hypothetical protein